MSIQRRTNKDYESLDRESESEISRLRESNARLLEALEKMLANKLETSWPEARAAIAAAKGEK